MLLVLGSAFNPIGRDLILVSGMGVSFGLTVGLLLVPGILESDVKQPGSNRPGLSSPSSSAWCSSRLRSGHSADALKDEFEGQFLPPAPISGSLWAKVSMVTTAKAGPPAAGLSSCR
jgi:hypothetical protein